MQPFAALSELQKGRAARGAGSLWLLALLLLLQWSVPGLAQASERRAGQGEAAGAAQSMAKLRDVGKLAGTELRTKDGKQQAAPSGGDPAFISALGASRCALSGVAVLVAAEQIAPGRIARLAFEARAPPAA